MVACWFNYLLLFSKIYRYRPESPIPIPILKGSDETIPRFWKVRRNDTTILKCLTKRFHDSEMSDETIPRFWNVQRNDSTILRIGIGIVESSRIVDSEIADSTLRKPDYYYSYIYQFLSLSPLSPAHHYTGGGLWVIRSCYKMLLKWNGTTALVAKTVNLIVFVTHFCDCPLHISAVALVHDYLYTFLRLILFTIIFFTSLIWKCKCCCRCLLELLDCVRIVLLVCYILFHNYMKVC